MEEQILPGQTLLRAELVLDGLARLLERFKVLADAKLLRLLFNLLDEVIEKLDLPVENSLNSGCLASLDLILFLLGILRPKLPRLALLRLGAGRRRNAVSSREDGAIVYQTPDDFFYSYVRRAGILRLHALL